MLEHPGWGGRREGAGRKPTVNTGRHRDTPHRRRPELDPRHPVHVTLRLERKLLSSLRNGKTYRALRPVLARHVDGERFRIVHFSLQSNHVHLIVEASDRVALSRGMQRFASNAARAIKTTVGGGDKVWAFRYHVTQMRTARQARMTLAYVLNNWRKHGVYEAAHAVVDPYATGLAHPAWAARFVKPSSYEPLPVSKPRTWLLRAGYKRFGEIDPHELPGFALL